MILFLTYAVFFTLEIAFRVVRASILERHRDQIFDQTRPNSDLSPAMLANTKINVF